MNPFRLTKADTLEISGVTFALEAVCEDGYRLLRKGTNKPEHYLYGELLRQWINGCLKLRYAKGGTE